MHGSSQQAARIRAPANQGQQHQRLSIQRRGVANVVAEGTVLFRDASNCDKWSVAAGPLCARCVINRVSRCERDLARECGLSVPVLLHCCTAALLLPWPQVVLSPQLCQNRQNPRVHRAFATLFGTPDLRTTLGRCGIMRPTRAVRFPKAPAPAPEPEP